MGCSSSASRQAKLDRLEQLELIALERPWTSMDRVTDLRKLQNFVQEDVAASRHDFPNLSTPEGQRAAKVCFQLKNELEAAVDEKLLKGGDALMITNLKRVAKDLDMVLDLRAVDAVVQRLADVQLELGNKELQASKLWLQEWAKINAMHTASSYQRQVDYAQKVHLQLQSANLYAQEAQVLQLEFVTQAKECARCLEFMLGGVLELFPAGMPIVEKIAGSLDVMCQRLKQGASWEPCAPKLQAFKSCKASRELPQKLEEAEAELAGIHHGFDVDMVLNVVEQAVAVWLASQGDQERLRSILRTLGRRVESDYGVALREGDDERLEMLSRAAERLEAAEKSWAEAEPSAKDLINRGIAENLNKKRAKQGIGMLMSQSKDLIDENKLQLRKRFESVEDRVKKTPKEELARSAEPPTWWFKLANGGQKSFGAEKSKEVEEYYQEWLKEGQPSDMTYQVSIQVQDRRKSTSHIREPCRYGDKCYQKNSEHRKRFAHPGDPDWPMADSISPTPPSTTFTESPSAPPPTSTTSTATSPREKGDVVPPTGTFSHALVSFKEETYVLNFALMTQSAKSKKNALRNINRKEGPTVGQQITAEYFELFDKFVNALRSNLEKIEFDLGLLEAEEHEINQKKLSDLVDSLRDILVDFLNLTSQIGETKHRDDTIARLGSQFNGLDVDKYLKDAKLSEALEALRAAYVVVKPRSNIGSASLCKWPLLQMLKTEKLLKARLALVDTKKDLRNHARRRAEMAFQTVLSDFGDNPEFKQKAQLAGKDVLLKAVQDNAKAFDIEAVKEALKLARSVSQVRSADVAAAAEWSSPFLPPVAAMLEVLLSSAASSTQPLERLIEVLDTCEDFSKLIAGTTPHQICNITKHVGKIALKVQGLVEEGREKICMDRRGALTDLVPVPLKLVSKLRGVEVKFHEQLWFWLHETKLNCQKEGDEVRIQAFNEWVCAYCEQTKQDLPDWMMTKNQEEASAKLKEALASGDFVKLREAAIFAKQSDYKKNASLIELYDDCMRKLKELQRLPEGWEVENLLGEDAQDRMFKQVDFGTEAERRLFQHLLDATNLRILTRDRLARDTTGMGHKVAKGFKVKSVQMVMNAESWGSYQKRLDEVVNDCKMIPSSAPMPPDRWFRWGGAVLTDKIGQQILEAAGQPPCTKEANEFLMLHGTNPKAADSIAQNHFDMAFACKTGLFGAGLYFGESSSKCDEYVQQREDGQFPMLLCRVVLGNINYCDSKDPTAKPGRKALEDSCTPAGGYHSVLGDRKKAKGTYREFIVYDHYQVYPLFIMWYTRNF